MRFPYSGEVLGVIAACVFLFGCEPQKPPKPPEVLELKENRPMMPEEEKSGILMKALENVNPFRPDHAVRSKAVLTSKVNELTGIVWDSRSPYAIISGCVVREGESIAEKRVIRIEKDYVVLEYGGFREILKLEKLIKRQREGVFDE